MFRGHALRASRQHGLEACPSSLQIHDLESVGAVWALVETKLLMPDSRRMLSGTARWYCAL